MGFRVEVLRFRVWSYQGLRFRVLGLEFGVYLPPPGLRTSSSPCSGAEWRGRGTRARGT